MIIINNVHGTASLTGILTTITNGAISSWELPYDNIIIVALPDIGLLYIVLYSTILSRK